MRALNPTGVPADGAVMHRPRTREDVVDDPAVRATVARLRASVLAAGCGSVAFLMLGLVAIHRAWRAGIARGREGGTEVGMLPPLDGIALVVLGFVALGVLIVLVAVFFPSGIVGFFRERAREKSVQGTADA